MQAATALITTTALVLGYLPATASAHDTNPDPNHDIVQYTDQGAYTDEEGREIQFAVWRNADELEADVSTFDPVTGDSLELWLEDDTVTFEGMLRGEAFRGSAPFTDFVDADTSAALCIGWVGLVCAGVLVILAASGGGCALFEGCDPKTDPEPPGGAGGVPGGAGGPSGAPPSGGGSGDGGGGDSSDDD